MEAPIPPPPQPLLFNGFRFALELFGWVGLGVWGWSLGDGGPVGTLLAVVFVVIGMVAWGVFRIPNDPPGKLHPPVRVSGVVRLAIELGFFAVSAAGLWLSGSRAASETLMTAVVLLYGVTWDRQRWLIRQ